MQAQRERDCLPATDAGDRGSPSVLHFASQPVLKACSVEALYRELYRNCTSCARTGRNTGSLIRGAKRGRRAQADSHPRANMTIFRSVLWSMAHGLARETVRGALDSAQAWWWIRGPSAGREQRRRCLKQGLAGWKQECFTVGGNRLDSNVAG
jgi:hypothetical protein